MILEKIFLQLGYECVSKDKENLDTLHSLFFGKIYHETSIRRTTALVCNPHLRWI